MKLHPVVLAVIVVAVILVAAFVLLFVQQGAVPEEVSDTVGTVLAEQAVAPLPDHDRDGTADSLDPDDDSDGLPDARDEYQFGGKIVAGSFSPDLDQDGRPNATDSDDDNDGKLDTSETGNYRYDHDNDGLIDYKDTDWDNDGKENWVEKFWVLYNDAKNSGISLGIDPAKVSTYTFADFPREAFTSLTGTSLTTVCTDRDNDRITDASDSRHNILGRFQSDANRYAHYDNQVAAKYAEIDPSNVPAYQPVHYGHWQNAEASAVAAGFSGAGGDPYAGFHPSGDEYSSHYQIPGTQPSSPSESPESTASGSGESSGGYQYPSSEGHMEYMPPPPSDSGGTH